MKPTREPLLAVYRCATSIATPLAPLLLAWRKRLGKEDPARLNERYGLTTRNRPVGPVAWLHGASVGESLALLPIVERLTGRGLSVLVTTGTVTSARILAARLPSGAFHQLAPLDVIKFVRRFLDHWRPDIVLIAESEIWPNTLREVERRSIPSVLVNARLSQRSFRRWGVLPGLIRSLLARFAIILAQSRDDAARLAALGAHNVRVVGNLKYDTPPLPVDQRELAALSAAFGSRPNWLAASIHPGEESIVLEAHLAQCARGVPILTIVAPRHVERGPEIALKAQALGLNVALRSRAEAPAPNVEIYVADTMGEMGLFYRLSAVVYVGKSLGGENGGQNPIEPAKLGAAIIHGPAIANFEEVYRAMDAASGAVTIADASSLAAAVGLLLGDPARARRVARAASDSIKQFTGATDAVMAQLESLLTRIETGSQ